MSLINELKDKRNPQTQIAQSLPVLQPAAPVVPQAPSTPSVLPPSPGASLEPPVEPLEPTLDPATELLPPPTSTPQETPEDLIPEAIEGPETAEHLMRLQQMSSEYIQNKLPISLYELKRQQEGKLLDFKFNGEIVGPLVNQYIEAEFPGQQQPTPGEIYKGYLNEYYGQQQATDINSEYANQFAPIISDDWYFGPSVDDLSSHYGALAQQAERQRTSARAQWEAVNNPVIVPNYNDPTEFSSNVTKPAVDHGASGGGFLGKATEFLFGKGDNKSESRDYGGGVIGGFARAVDFIGNATRSVLSNADTRLRRADKSLKQNKIGQGLRQLGGVVTEGLGIGAGIRALQSKNPRKTFEKEIKREFDNLGKAVKGKSFSYLEVKNKRHPQGFITPDTVKKYEKTKKITDLPPKFWTQVGAGLVADAITEPFGTVDAAFKAVKIVRGLKKGSKAAKAVPPKPPPKALPGQRSLPPVRNSVRSTGGPIATITRSTPTINVKARTISKEIVPRTPIVTKALPSAPVPKPKFTGSDVVSDPKIQKIIDQSVANLSQSKPGRLDPKIAKEAAEGRASIKPHPSISEEFLPEEFEIKTVVPSVPIPKSDIYVSDVVPKSETKQIADVLPTINPDDIVLNKRFLKKVLTKLEVPELKNALDEIVLGTISETRLTELTRTFNSVPKKSIKLTPKEEVAVNLFKTTETTTPPKPVEEFIKDIANTPIDDIAAKLDAEELADAVQGLKNKEQFIVSQKLLGKTDDEIDEAWRGIELKAERQVLEESFKVLVDTDAMVDDLGVISSKADEVKYEVREIKRLEAATDVDMSDKILAKADELALSQSTKLPVDEVAPIIQKEMLSPPIPPSKLVESIANSTDAIPLKPIEANLVPRSNIELSELARFLGHTTYPGELSRKQLNGLANEYGSLYYKMGKPIDVEALRNPLARIALSDYVPDGTPPLSQLIDRSNSMPLVERPMLSLEERSLIEQAINQNNIAIALSDDLDYITKLEKENDVFWDKLINTPEADLTDPENFAFIQKTLPEELKASSSEGVQLTAEVIETEKTASNAMETVRYLQEEAAKLDVLIDDMYEEMEARPDRLAKDADDVLSEMIEIQENIKKLDPSAKFPNPLEPVSEVVVDPVEEYLQSNYFDLPADKTPRLNVDGSITIYGSDISGGNILVPKEYITPEAFEEFKLLDTGKAEEEANWVIKNYLGPKVKKTFPGYAPDDPVFDSVRQYTVSSKDINDTLRGSRSDKSLKVAVKHLLELFNNPDIPKYQGPLFRGYSPRSQEVVDKFWEAAKKGEEIKFSGFSSWSRNATVANAFVNSTDVGTPGILLKFPNAKGGLDIDSVSTLPEEAEVMMRNDLQLRPINAYEENGVKVVEVELWETKPINPNVGDVFEGKVWNGFEWETTESLTLSALYTGKTVDLEQKRNLLFPNFKAEDTKYFVDYTQSSKDLRAVDSGATSGTPKQIKALEVINQFLNDPQTPRYSGPIYRGLRTNSIDSLNSLIESASKGEVIKLEALSSFSRNADVAGGFTNWDKRVVLKVEDNTHGVDIDSISFNSKEQEILVAKNVEYRPINVTQEGDTWTITAQEVNPFKATSVDSVTPTASLSEAKISTQLESVNQKAWFHGTKKQVDNIALGNPSDYTSPSHSLGLSGLSLTDNAEIAANYAKSQPNFDKPITSSAPLQDLGQVIEVKSEVKKTLDYNRKPTNVQRDAFMDAARVAGFSEPVLKKIKYQLYNRPTDLLLYEIKEAVIDAWQKVHPAEEFPNELIIKYQTEAANNLRRLGFDSVSYKGADGSEELLILGGAVELPIKTINKEGLGSGDMMEQVVGRLNAERQSLAANPTSKTAQFNENAARLGFASKMKDRVAQMIDDQMDLASKQILELADKEEALEMVASKDKATKKAADDANNAAMEDAMRDMLNDSADDVCF